MHRRQMTIRSLRRVTAVSSVLLLFCLAVSPVYGDVKVVGDKCVQVDGKPFFPIGMYYAGVGDIPVLAEAGFNLVHDYTWDGEEVCASGQVWLDTAHEHGMMALVGLYRPAVKKMEFDTAIARIKKYRDHPALLAWHTMDEPAWDREGNRGKDYMPAAYKMIKAHDTSHPVTAVVCHFADPSLFAPFVDVVQADYYPIPPIPATDFAGTGFRGIKRFVELSREHSQGQKPFWFVCQAFDYSTLKGDVPAEWKRFPTQRELRTMTYTAVATGARGILYYGAAPLMLDKYQRGSTMTRVRNWERLKSVTLELQQLLPLLTADTPESIQTSSHVTAMVKSDGRDIYIIAANYERAATEADIRIPGVREATAEAVFGQEGTVQIKDGKLTLGFEPIQSHVYRIRPEQIIAREDQGQ